MVGRLVEQQGRVGAGATLAGGEQDSCQLDATPLATGECPQRLGEHPLRKAQARTDPAGLAFRGVAAQGGETFLEVPVPADGLVSGIVVDDLGHEYLLLLQIRQQGVQAAGGQHAVAGQDVEVSLAGSCGRYPTSPLRVMVPE